MICAQISYLRKDPCPFENCWELSQLAKSRSLRYLNHLRLKCRLLAEPLFNPSIRELRTHKLKRNVNVDCTYLSDIWTTEEETVS